MLRVEEISLGKSFTLWQNLIDKSVTASFFQQPDWLSLWRQHFGGQKEVILGIYQQQELIGVVPFCQSGNTITFLGIDKVLGRQKVSDFGDIIAKTSYEEIVWKEILAKVKSFQINLNFIREDSPSFKILQELGGKAQVVDVAPYLDLPKTWDEYLAKLDRHNRHELRRKIRRLEEKGAFKICYSGEPSDIEEFFSLMALSNEQKKDFLSEKMKSFFQDIFNTFWQKKRLQLCFLKLGGVNIAAAVLFVFKDELLLYNSGFDPKYAYLAPGLLLKTFLIKQAIEEGKERFDFLRGGERYKYELGGKSRELYRITF